MRQVTEHLSFHPGPDRTRRGLGWPDRLSLFDQVVAGAGLMRVPFSTKSWRVPLFLRRQATPYFLNHPSIFCHASLACVSL